MNGRRKWEYYIQVGVRERGISEKCMIGVAWIEIKALRNSQ